jgi:hypothetical protein
VRLIEIVRRSLQGETFVTASEAFRTLASHRHGHVEAVLGTMRKLGIDTLLASNPSQQGLTDYLAVTGR